MRIVLIGQAAFGESVLRAMAERGKKVVAVFTRPDSSAEKPEPLKVAADDLGIEVFQFGRMRDVEAIESFRGLNSDLCVMAFVTDIVPAEILDAPSLGTIQYHPSLLPKHRGPSSINWAIIHGDTKTGLSIFWPDDGIDTGPILLQKEIEIGSNDTLGNLYFDRLFPLGVEAMVEAVEMVEAGTAPRLEQDESEATYEGWCRAKDVVIDWSAPAATVHNLIRGADPSPGAGTTFQGKPLQLYAVSRESSDADSGPGEVVEVSGAGFKVAASGGTISVTRLRFEGGPKVAASGWAQSVGLKPGMRLGD